MENKRGIKPKEEEITDPLFKKLKDDLQKASYFAKLGNKDKTTQYATMAFNKALQKKDFLKAHWSRTSITLPLNYVDNLLKIPL